VTVLTVSETTAEERAMSCGVLARQGTTRVIHLSYPRFSFFFTERYFH